MDNLDNWKETPIELKDTLEDNWKQNINRTLAYMHCLVANRHFKYVIAYFSRLFIWHQILIWYKLYKTETIYKKNRIRNHYHNQHFGKNQLLWYYVKWWCIDKQTFKWNNCFIKLKRMNITKPLINLVSAECRVSQYDVKLYGLSLRLKYVRCK